MKSNTTYTGTIIHMAFEGGFYGIVTDNNLKFLPNNLAAQYQQNGAIIEFTGKVITDTYTIEQWGTPFNIGEINLIKPGNTTKEAVI